MRTETLDAFALALEDEDAARRLAPYLTSSAALGHNPFYLQVGQRLQEHLEEYGELPSESDWKAWTSNLNERKQRGVQKALGEIRARRVNGDSPRATLDRAEETMKRLVVQNAGSEIAAWQPEQGEKPPIHELKVAVELLENGAGEWPDPVPLGIDDYPEPYALDGLPAWFTRYVESVADSTQSARDMALMMGLATLSTALAKKGEVRVKRGRTEPLLLWTCTVLESGERKSAVVPKITAPVAEWERAENIRAEQDRPPAEDVKDIYEKQLKQAKRDAAKGGEDVDPDEIVNLRRRLEEAKEEIPGPVDLTTGDVTEERLGTLMAENDGRIAVLDPEGELFALMAGRYNRGTPQFGLHKKAWSLDQHKVARQSRDDLIVENPALTLGIATQPVVLEDLAERDRFEREGLLARFLFARPEPMAGRRETGEGEPELDLEARDAWSARVRELLRLDPAGVDDSTGEWEPHTLVLEQGAREELWAFADWIEPRLRPHQGPLSEVAEWANKLEGQAVRLAGLIHCARHARSDPWQEPISGETMEAAVRLARASIPHAKMVLEGHVEASTGVQLAQYVLHRIEQDPEDLTERDLFKRVRGKSGIGTIDDLREILDRLEDHDLVRVRKRPSSGGRPPSPWVRLNPKAAE